MRERESIRETETKRELQPENTVYTRMCCMYCMIKKMWGESGGGVTVMEWHSTVE